MNYAHRTQVAVVCGRCGARSQFCHASAPGTFDDATCVAEARAVDDGWRRISLRYAEHLASLGPSAMCASGSGSLYPPFWHCRACATAFLAWLAAPELTDRKAQP